MKKLYAAFLCLYFFSPLTGQRPARVNRLEDSLTFLKEDTTRVNTYRFIGTSFYSIEPDSAIYYTRKGLALAEKLKWIKGIAQNALNLGSSYYFIARYDSAIYYATNALAAAKIVGEKKRIALVYINRGSSYTETQQYEKAIQDLSAAMRISEEIGDKDRLARTSQSMCELYMYQENYDAALPWAEKALRLGTELGDTIRQSIAQTSIGGIYVYKGKLKEAELILLNAIQKSTSIHRKDVIIECAISLSDIYLRTKKPKQSIDILQTGLKYAQELHLTDRESSIWSSLGDTYLLMENYDMAFAGYRNGYTIIKGKKEFQKNQYQNLEGMAKTSAKLGRYKEASEYLFHAATLKDSVTQNKQDEKLLRLQTQFETDRKEKEIELLKKNQALGNVELQKQQTIKFGAFILAGLLAVIGFLVVNRYRVIQKAKRMVEIEKLRNDIARDLHDDIGSALSSININSNMALSRSGEQTVVQAQLEKIKANSGRIMESMGDIVWAINPGNDSIENLAVKMKEFMTEILEPLNIDYRLTETESLKKIKLPIDKRKEIYLVFKEAVNNAAKYSNCRNMSVVLNANAAELQMQVTDDGNGFDTADNKTGNGLRNMKQRAASMGGSLQIDTAIGKGTTVHLKLPIT